MLRNPSKQGFMPVMDMIVKGVLTLLTADSAKGFMVKLDVNINDAEYTTLDDSGEFKEVVNSYILKFAVITDRMGKLADFVLPDKTIKKLSETYESFFHEAQVQQQIWETSILNGKSEICPSVANLAFFTDSNYLIDTMSKRTTDLNLQSVLSYFIENNYDIGVLTMPTVPNSITLGQFIKLHRPNDPEMVRSAKISVAIKIIRLFLQGILHLDLHPGNSLIYETPSGIRSRMIDFGLIETQLNPECIQLKQELEGYLAQPPDEALQTNIIRRILLAINTIDYQINMTQYAKPVNYSQMRWTVRPFLRQEEICDQNNVLIFQGVVEASKPVSQLSREQIDRYKEEGFLINLDSIDSFIPTSAARLRRARMQASAEGGRRTKRKRKKTRIRRLTRVRF